MHVLSISFAQPDVLITDADYTSSGQGIVLCATDLMMVRFRTFMIQGAGAGLWANENDTITFCPDGTGSKVFIAFGINTGLYFGCRCFRYNIFI